MFAAIPRVEALVRIRCVRCDYGFALVGEPADRTIYRFFFDGLKFTDRIPATCPSCQFQSATIDHADYVLPVAVK